MIISLPSRSKFFYSNVGHVIGPKFIPGLKLSKLFYRQQVKPILDEEFPGLRYSAALIGWGSEVLGFDTPISRDHHWGPRVLLFLSENDYRKLKGKISRALSLRLPFEFMGYSTNTASRNRTECAIQSALLVVQ